ncbi:PAS domain-containing sensor histidine kinase [Pontibacter arcticus]|nr:ATP-binding protein [Pontibacter arcticus]
MYSILDGGGEMGARMRAYDWDAHPLGSPDNWPQSLKINIRLLLNSGFPMFFWWSEDLYMFHNDAYLPALGKKHPKALGAKANEMWAEVWNELGLLVEKVIKNGQTVYEEALRLVLQRKGFLEETYWTFSYSPAYNDAGKIEGVFCACFEVTKSVVTQRRLKTMKDISDTMAQVKTQEQACETACIVLRDNQADIPFGLIYLLNSDGTEARLMGQTGTKLPPANALKIDIGSSVAEDMWQLNKVFIERQPILLESMHTRYTSVSEHDENNETVEQAVILPILRPGQNQVIGFFIAGLNANQEYNTDYLNFYSLLVGQVATAITNAQDKQEIARQQMFLTELFLQAPVAIGIMRGPLHIIELANPNICRLWGRQSEDVLRKPVMDALPELRDQGIKELLDGVLASGKPYINNELPVTLEHEGVLQQMYFNIVYHPLRDAEGVISGVIAIAINVTEQVTTRHKIEKMNTELLATNADLDNFVYSASHDLKAPISNIEGLMRELVEYLPASTLEQEVVQKLLELIHSSVDRFKRAVTDLTEVAKIQREAGEDVAAINLADVVNEVILDFETIANTSNAVIHLDMEPGVAIQFSAKNSRSIVYNLISNALKYKSPDRQPEITVKTETRPGFVVLTVADNGLGIDMADKNKIFSMFKRLHDHVEGSGIGLYIVKRIVENAGGKIEVESELGHGTTFRIYFKR